MDTFHEKFPDSCGFPGMVEGIVIDPTAQRSPIPIGGLEIKLKLYFRDPKVSIVKQLRSFIPCHDWETEKKHDIDHDAEDDDDHDFPEPDHTEKDE